MTLWIKLAEAANVLRAKEMNDTQRVADFHQSLKPGDLLFSAPDPKKAKGFLGKVFKPLSRKIQGTDYGHTALYVGDGNIIESRIGEGVRKKPLTAMTQRNDVVASRVNATDEERRRAIQYAHDQLGVPYAMWKMIRSGTPFRGSRVGDSAERARELQCAALVANAYANKKFGDSSRLMLRPSEILDSKEVTPVGSLTRFNKARAAGPLTLPPRTVN